MAIKKNILIDGIEVPFKASAAIPRVYRIRFRRDIFADLAQLKKAMDEDETFSIPSLEVFEDIAYIMAKHADPENVPNEPDEWLDQFNFFSIYDVLPKLIELWGLNLETEVNSKKNIARLTAK